MPENKRKFSKAENNNNKVLENISIPKPNKMKATQNTKDNEVEQTISDISKNNRRTPASETKDVKVSEIIPAVGPDNLKAQSQLIEDNRLGQTILDVPDNNGATSSPETQDIKVRDIILTAGPDNWKAPSRLTEDNQLGQTISDMPENNVATPASETADSKDRRNILLARPDNLKVSSKTADNGVCQSTLDVHRRNETHSSQESENIKVQQETLEVPDGGFGWIVVLAISCPIIFLQFTSNFGILFSPPLLQMGASSSTIAGIFTIYATMWNLSGPFVGPLSQQLGWRAIGIGGYLLISISIISSAFVTKPFYLYFTFSVLTGIGAGLLGNQAFLIIASYFKKRRGLANAIFMAGCSSGHFLGPLVLTYLLENYSFKITALIYGTAILNGCALSMLYHPVEWHRINKDNSTYKISKITISSSKDDSKKVNSAIFVVIQKIIQNSRILSSYRAIILVLANAFVREGYAVFQIMVPFALQSEGHPLETAAWCLSIASIGNIISRIINSVLSDQPWYNMQLVYVKGILLTAISILVFSLTSDMFLRKATMVVFGYGTGILLTLHNLVMVEVMGLENIAAMVGVSCLANAGAAFTIGPVAGLIRDMSGSYTVSTQFVVGIISLSFLLWLLMPMAKRLDRERTIRSQTNFIKDIEKSRQTFSGNEDISYEGKKV